MNREREPSSDSIKTVHLKTNGANCLKKPFRVWGRGDSRLGRFGVRLPHRRGGRRSRSRVKPFFVRSLKMALKSEDFKFNRAPTHLRTTRSFRRSSLFLSSVGAGLQCAT
ncbi:hypothetical protein OPV22_023703 [Ensete ventricosum]|uniref:Uncharacterized protein n=1 Tax=Ensete ventricosum TaxID=4639 RepID=A0AAV8PD21_ENSVE|nr:hypothetical protein OPV22_023703 [Ensete ventricosum]